MSAYLYRREQSTDMLRFCLLGLLFLTIFTFRVQATSELDSLRKVLQTAPPDTHRVQALNRLGFILKASQPDSAMNRLQEAASLASQLGFKKGEGKARLYRGQSLTATGDYKKGMNELKLALALYTEASNTAGIGKTWNSIGIIHYSQQDFDRASKAYSRALEHFSNPFYIATAHNNIALNRKLAGDGTGFIKHQILALEKFSDLGNQQMELYALGNLAIFYFERGDLAKATEYNQKGYERLNGEGSPEERLFLGSLKGEILAKKGESEDALAYFQEMRALAASQGLLREEASSWNNIARILNQQGKNEEALERLAWADSLFRELGDLRGQAVSLANQGVIRIENDKKDSGQVQMQKGLQMALKLGEPVTLGRIFDLISKGYELLGEQELALHYRKRHSEIQAQLMAPEQWREILAAENAYHDRNKDRLLNRLQAEMETAQGQNLLLWIALGAALVAVLGLTIRGFRQKQKSIPAQGTGPSNHELAIIQAETRGRIQELRALLQEKEQQVRELQSQPKPSPVKPQLPPYFETLTSREIEVFLCLGTGLSDKGIANELSISLATVRTHTRNVYSKLNLNNRAGAIKMAHEFRLLRKPS